ncbi:hypothetical protein K1T71_013777 [Dendrolimus kikuchii]|uniref:Uncharacterized protein n=1 Tax=Dendrolimus kikuchii TaxID=765133 RepID=A0ACC1CFZ5_9NEOP|nr:hypothetical protein K1T71_013777 [Dendrolimus kikuchii]
MFGLASTIGVLSSFDHHGQDWKTYKSRLEQWFIANNLDEESDKAGVKRKAVLLSALSESTYQLASNLVLPDDLVTQNYSSIVGKLTEHFTTRRCGFAERHKFYEAIQLNGETHSQWAARLRGLAAHCGFKNIEDALLDKFVMGMLPGPEKEKLFVQEIGELTLGKAVNLAEEVRCARTAAAAGSASTADGVYKMDRGSSVGVGRKVPPVGNKCSVCGYKNHTAKECRFSNYKCKKCNRKGHLRKMCPGNPRVRYLEEGNGDDEGDDGKFLHNISCPDGEPLVESVCLGGRNLKCEIDSGSPVSVISEKTYKNNFSNVPLSPPSKRLSSYDGANMSVLGTITVTVKYLSRTAPLCIYVIKDGGPPLLGRDFMRVFKLQLISTLAYCKSNEEVLSELIKLYPKLFSNQLGCFNKYEIDLPLKSDAKPVFMKSRPVPYALKEKINAELHRLESLGILVPVKHSDYASPIVPVLKSDGSVRICADYSQTINKQLFVEKYPLPSVQDLFTKLHHGIQYSKLDLSMAYNQFKIKVSSQKLTCINTPRGLFNYTRLVFGLSSAPAIFQRAIESIVGDMEGVFCFLDDLILTDVSKDGHEQKLNEVLRRLQEAGLTLHKDKCAFFQDQVTYLGYVIDKNGIRKNPDKVSAILEAPIPKNVQELQSFLGLINYYRNFIANASSILSPLHFLLQKGVKWNWNYEQDKAFETIKNQMASDQVLAHFNSQAKVILTVDASPVGLGAILSQVDSDGVERPVSYASRSLTPAERKYAQIQKEATAIIFGVRKFHQFLYGRSDPFILRTDHKPLTAIFKPGRGIPEITANRLQRYAIFLSAYNYVIEYVNSAANTADFLSRAIPVHKSVGGGASDHDAAAYVNFVVEGCLPVTLQDVNLETARDPTLKKVSDFVLKGWPRKISDPTLKPFHLCKNEIALENGVLMRGYKVIIPHALRKKVLEELHSSHFGVVKMKSEARSRFWFPGIDAELEKLVGACAVCVQLKPAPPRTHLAPWPYPPYAFHRIHIDFFGPINNKTYLIVVDAFSKWVECYDMKGNLTAKAVIAKLCDFMSRYGMPEIMVSDNGTSFASKEMSEFCKLNYIKQLFSPVYHPASNGQAESFVKIIKKGIKSILLSERKANDLHMHLCKFLFDYRNSKNSTTETSPAQLIFGHNLRSRLDLIVPHNSPSSSELSSRVDRKQSLQAEYYGGVNNKHFLVDDLVWVKEYVNKNKHSWSKGRIVRRTGKVTYEVQLINQDKVVQRHRNQLYIFKGERSPQEHRSPVIEWEKEASKAAVVEAGDRSTVEEAEVEVIQNESRVPQSTASPERRVSTSSPRSPEQRPPRVDEPVAEPSSAQPTTLDLRPVESGISRERSRRDRPPVDYRKYF